MTHALRYQRYLACCLRVFSLQGQVEYPRPA
nr:MAG TPA: hypothetical protein [Caudoviricetes sp.]